MMKLPMLLLLIGTALVAFLGSALLGKWLIPRLHKLHFGQVIREDGPSWHEGKKGTPTMGGLMFIAAALVAALIATVVYAIGWKRTPFGDVRLLAGWIMALCCGLIGLADDFIKVARKRNLGLTSRQKLLLQLLVALAYGLCCFLGGKTSVYVPFAGYVRFGFWFVPFAVLVIVGTMNATNLTDGIDGLCGTLSFIVCLFFLSIAGVRGFVSQSLTAAAGAGALAGFLIWNLHPARVFMGDTGSLFIGGWLCAIAFGIQQPFLLIPGGIVFIGETLSVIAQVVYFKATHGKRLFKMAPLHHHCELCGWDENKIVTVFSLVTLAGCLLGTILFTRAV